MMRQDNVLRQTPKISRKIATGNLLLQTLLWILTAWLFAGPIWAGCGDNSPAFPVPENRGIAALWPPNGFHPGNPGVQLPSERDSTDYLSTTIPGFASGHELFQSLDIANGHLYVAYNAGLQVWNIEGANADSPARSHTRDGWIGQFNHFPAPGEASNFVEDIAVREGSGGEVLIVVSGLDQVGTSLWRHTAADSLNQISQHTTRVTRQVRMGKIGSAVYAFGASSDDGVVVFNASTGAYLGRLANDSSSKRYLDTLERDGKIFVAATNGNSIRMKIWEVANPSSPSSAIQRYDGESLGSGVKGVSLFEHNGDAYMAIVKSHIVYIYDVDNCLDTNGCTNPGSPVWQFALPGSWPSFEFLTFSRGLDNTPYLYYGMDTSGLSGTKKEMLFDLSTLGTTNAITEITDGGETYNDNCGNQVDYWGEYYDGNEHGFRNYHPRIGKWSGNVFYRATNATLDVHILGNAPEADPIVTTTAAATGPYWMSTPGAQAPIFFTATDLNCTGNSSWTWFEDDPLGSVSGTSTTGTLVSDVCATSDCPSRDVEVWATKNICSGDPDLTINRATVTVQEPRAQIRSIDTAPTGNPPGEFPVCTILELSADLDGRDPFTYDWTVTRDDSGQVVASGTGATLSWDTTGESIDPPIFADGFESGDLSAWTLAEPLSEGGIKTIGPSQSTYAARNASRKGAAATYTVDLDVTNLNGTHQATDQRTITLVGLGALGISGIGETDQGSGQFLLQANSTNATEWRWEIENDAGGTDIFDWGEEDDTLVYQWSVEGTRTVTVFATNCEAGVGGAVSTSIDIEIIDPTPLNMTDFSIDGPNSPNCDFQVLNQQWECTVNQAVRFNVEADGSPDSFEFDWDNNGTVDQTISAGGTFIHTYTSVGPVTSAARAKKGADVSSWSTLSLQVF